MMHMAKYTKWKLGVNLVVVRFLFFVKGDQ